MKLPFKSVTGIALLSVAILTPLSAQARMLPGFYSRIGMKPPGILYLWPSPWDNGFTDV